MFAKNRNFGKKIEIFGKKSKFCSLGNSYKKSQIYFRKYCQKKPMLGLNNMIDFQTPINKKVTKFDSKKSIFL